MNEHLHIGIENSGSNRKELLNFNIDIIKALTRIENLKRIRYKKKIQLNKLRMLTKRLGKSIVEFKSELPRAKEPLFIAKEKQKPNLVGSKTALNQKPAKNKNEGPANTNISRLEEELKKLKEKIDKL